MVKLRALTKEPFRNHGYGTEALSLVEAQAKLQGYKKMGLNVFRFNQRAYALYERCGYYPFARYEGNIHMEKELE